MVSRFGVAVLRGLRLPFSLLLRARLRLIDLAVELLALFVANVAAVASRGCRRRRVAEGNPRLVWGSTPLVNNVYWSRERLLVAGDARGGLELQDLRDPLLQHQLAWGL